MKILLVFALIACVAEAQLAGGLIDVDPQREDVLAAANFAYTLGVNSINSAYTHRLVKVVKAQSQVVAGTKYYLTLEIGETDCFQHNQIDETSCKVTVRIMWTLIFNSIN